MTSTNLTAALVLARTGLPVFPIYEITNGVCACGDPCGSPGKHPRIREGLYGATTDQGIIRGWWQKWPDANLAIATGAGGLVVIDVDPDHGGDESWRDLLAEMGSSIGETVTAITGSGGTHLLYRAPEDVELRNTAGRLGPGIDTRGAGGYIVVAPSNHVSGNRYAWEEGYAPWDRRPSPLPAALMERLTRPTGRSGSDDGGERADMRALLHTPCPQGQRDNTLIRLVGWLRSNTTDRAIALDVLLRWNADCCQPPLDDAVVVEKVNRAWERWSGPARVEWKRFEQGEWGEEPGGEDEGGAPENETDAPRRKSRFPIFDAVDFLEHQPPPWLIEGIVPSGSFGCVYGPPGGGKTFYCLHMAACCATGMSFFGHNVAQDVGAVIYVAAEGSGGLSKRIRAWQDHFGIEIPRGRLFILPAQVPFVDEGAVRALLADIRALDTPVSHVFIDTVSRALAGGDENHPEPMGAFVMACGMVQQSLGANVTAIHHGTKQDGSLRGHSSLPGALDWIVRVTTLGEGDTKVVRVVGEKQKDEEEQPLTELRPVLVDVTRYYQDAPPSEADGPLVMRPRVTSLVLEPLSEIDRERQEAERKERMRSQRESRLAPTQYRVADALHAAHGEAWASHDQWWRACREKGMQTPDRQGYRHAQKRLVEMGYVESREIGGQVEYRCTSKLLDVLQVKAEKEEPDIT